MSSEAPAPELAVARLLEQLGGCGAAHCSGLNAAQWTALRYFRRANRFSRTVSAFALYHGTTRGTASQTIKTLATKGYLRRRPLEHDQRSFRLELTPKGRRALELDPLDEYVSAARALTEEERIALARGLGRMLERMRTGRERPVFGECTSCRHLRAQGECPEVEDGYRCALQEERLERDDLAALCVDYEPRQGV